MRNVRPRMKDAVRKLIEATAKERGYNLAKLSRELGRNPAYMQQFIERGVPQTLPEKTRWRLADILGLDESLLGAPKRVKREPSSDLPLDGKLTAVNMRDIRLSAGPGAEVDEDNSTTAKWPFPQAYLRHTLSLRTPNLEIVEVVGDSMEPTLHSGDRIMVDLSDKDVTAGGVFALYDGQGTVIKRVEKVPLSDPPQVVLISDNPHHNQYTVLADLVNIAGRVVWYGRRL